MTRQPGLFFKRSHHEPECITRHEYCGQNYYHYNIITTYQSWYYNNIIIIIIHVHCISIVYIIVTVVCMQESTYTTYIYICRVNLCMGWVKFQYIIAVFNDFACGSPTENCSVLYVAIAE